MKTDDLIKLLAEDAPPPMRLTRAVTIALASGVLISGALLLSTLGMRHDMMSALETIRVLFKIGFSLLLAATACGLVYRIGRPGVGMTTSALLLLAPLVLLLAGVAIELSVLPSGLWEANMMGRSAGYCVVFIPLLSLAPLAALFLALKNGAPERPALAGAAAGLAASSLAAALYAWHCADDSPLFVATWYGIAITVVTVVGAALGARYLRW
ncbi:DUF1109 domain-containing protein [Rhizobium sp. S152]|uniref:DUF1109 domain-containing protein n=1 Tax=Rhizobium sp. S152 TaxID=3055038 RepID=UPI0025A9B087|nr:DUF1109 domain-containing protein [Rhizobium sp. S152]MDM9626884.1 DUF1109 domain-containing protein [Rhizobium sp. S152]